MVSQSLEVQKCKPSQYLYIITRVLALWDFSGEQWSVLSDLQTKPAPQGAQGSGVRNLGSAPGHDIS